MSLVLHPRVAPGDRLRVWLGSFGRTTAPNLTWTVNGQSSVPTVLRPLQSARDSTMVAPQTPRAFTGIFEFSDGIEPGRWYEVRVRAGDGRSTHLPCRTLPARLPGTFDAPFNVLLVSCFHATEDRGGLAGDVVSQMGGNLRPHLTLLLGDQVYLDLPTLRKFPHDVAGLAEKFEEDYRTNWAGELGYAKILQAAPVTSTPDDHEYWNNYPHPATVVPNTYTEAGRRAWETAARAMYEAFQLAQPEGFEEAVEIDVEPLSIFMLDTRTFRAPDRSRSVHPAVFEQFKQWTERVAGSGLYGTVVTGQSLFDEPASRLRGAVADRTLANYGDYEAIVRQLEWLADHGRPVLCITGDVHWGRVLETHDRHRGRAKFYEVISSPTSLVTTIGADQLKSLGARIGGFFGRTPEPWPRHGDPKDPPELFAPDELRRRFVCRRPPIHPQKGNHVAMLSFNRSGMGIDLRVSYWPIYPEGRPAPPTRLRAIHLSPVA